MTCKTGAFFVLTLMLMSAPATAIECPLSVEDNRQIVRSGAHAISVMTVPEKVEVGSPFDVSVVVCNADGTPFEGGVSARALMPMHKHGMNYQPVITNNGLGHYHGTGFLFHMPGQWQYVFDLRQGDETDRVLIDHMLK